MIFRQKTNSNKKQEFCAKSAARTCEPITGRNLPWPLWRLTTDLVFVHCVQGILPQRRSIGHREVKSAYHSDEAISSGVINETKLSVHLTMKNTKCPWVWISLLFILFCGIHYVHLPNCSVEKMLSLKCKSLVHCHHGKIWTHIDLKEEPSWKRTGQERHKSHVFCWQRRFLLNKAIIAKSSSQSRNYLQQLTQPSLKW